MRFSEVLGATFSNWLGICFYLLFHSIYDIRVKGLSNYKPCPSTIITINHKRDLDIPIVGSLLQLQKFFFNNKLRLYYVARDDLFHPGFLTSHFPIFGITSRLVHKINLSLIMRALRAYPMSHITRNRIGYLMREMAQIDGKLQLKNVVTPSGLEILSNLLGSINDSDLATITVSDFLGYRYSNMLHKTTDVNILQDEWLKPIRSKTLGEIKKQLTVFANILNNGGICMLAPEGDLSTDGRFWPVRSGLYRLISMTKGDIRVLPINTTYDFMTRDRMKVYINIGKEMTGLKQLDKNKLERQVQMNISSLATITMGQIGSGAILGLLEKGCRSFKESELLDIILSKVKEINSRGFFIDKRLFSIKSLKRRYSDFLEYCTKRNIIIPEQNVNSYLISSNVENNKGDRFCENPVLYSANELHSIIKF
ncbi:MAG: 1-acyl-sn-glycerol-3-phosphate acyltransferase [Dehalococcoidia bacterium]|nr:MAG: 1-acyl-sn-glycerol-3-phosphate acyltransferase [Dehalococcoidia bacterium]